MVEAHGRSIKSRSSKSAEVDGPEVITFSFYHLEKAQFSAQFGPFRFRRQIALTDQFRRIRILLRLFHIQVDQVKESTSHGCHNEKHSS